MSTKKRGLLTVSGEWARHLRPYGRRQFWRGERMATRSSVGHDLREVVPGALEDPAPGSRFVEPGPAEDSQ